MKTVCHVGHTESQDDFNRIIECIEWCDANSHLWPKRGKFLDIQRGQDFLSMKTKYDVVVLHFIFRGGFMVPSQTGNALMVSPLASWSAWRKRLVSSGANLIFAFGGIAEVSGTFLCNLDGYKIHKIRTEDCRCFGERDSGHNGLWIFEKE